MTECNPENKLANQNKWGFMLKSMRRQVEINEDLRRQAKDKFRNEELPKMTCSFTRWRLMSSMGINRWFFIKQWFWRSADRVKSEERMRKSEARMTKSGEGVTKEWGKSEHAVRVNSKSEEEGRPLSVPFLFRTSQSSWLDQERERKLNAKTNAPDLRKSCGANVLQNTTKQQQLGPPPFGLTPFGLTPFGLTPIGLGLPPLSNWG